ncbi:BamA/TamA family outer membrane protein [Sulfurovum sp.]|uniref:autotransporter assembly complex protein TamA n=1 Tax=Sulfurovum sp. TaxID=1969726 RepID=UPI0028681D9C|nr:BamA/TamA family outer membrane protein [Sulfurovum sp.]
MQRSLKVWIVLLFCTFLMADELELPTHEIHFTGQQHFEESDLQDALSVDAASFWQFWKDDTPRLKDKLRPTLEPSLISFYRSEGFYDANFTIEENNTNISVSITENEPVRVRDINISSDFDLQDLVILEKGTIFRVETFTSIKSNIIEQLLKEGYCSYDLDAKAYVDLDEHIVDFQYKLTKGGICTFGKLTTSGLKTIDDDVILSRVRALEGERFNTELVQETSNNLYALTSFDSVLISVDRKFYNVVPVDIKFKEMEKPYHTEIGLGYDTYVGARVHGNIVKNNFYGQAQKLKLQLAWSKKEQLARLDFFKPALLNLFTYNIDFGANLGYSNLEYDGFQEEMEFARGYLEYHDGRLKLRAGMAVENIRIDALDNIREGEDLEQAVNEGLFLLTYSYVDFVYDARDSKLNPKFGYYLAAYAEAGFSSDEDTSAYHKTQYEGRLIYTFANLTLSTVGKVGVVEAESAEGLPESKYFFAGGSYSNRAYGYREIGVILSPTEDTINGASSMANLSLEANYPVWGDVYGAVFTDNTMLTDESYNFDGEIITSAGLGVRYMTPIGPFKLDVGFNVQDTSQYAISFQIGQSF